MQLIDILNGLVEYNFSHLNQNHNHKNKKSVPKYLYRHSILSMQQTNTPRVYLTTEKYPQSIPLLSLMSKISAISYLLEVPLLTSCI